MIVTVTPNPGLDLTCLAPTTVTVPPSDADLPPVQVRRDHRGVLGGRTLTARRRPPRAE